MYIVIQHSAPEPPIACILKTNIYWLPAKCETLNRTHSLLQTPDREGIVVILLLQLRKLRHLEVNWLVFGDIAGPWGNFRALDPSPQALIYHVVWYDAQFGSLEITHGYLLCFGFFKKLYGLEYF